MSINISLGIPGNMSSSSSTSNEETTTAATTSTVVNAAVTAVVGGKTLGVIRKIFVRLCYLVAVVFLTEVVFLFQKQAATPTSTTSYDYSFINSFVNRVVAAMQNNTVPVDGVGGDLFAK